jgi:hypothetical protein
LRSRFLIKLKQGCTVHLHTYLGAMEKRRRSIICTKEAWKSMFRLCFSF